MRRAVGVEAAAVAGCRTGSPAAWTPRLITSRRRPSTPLSAQNDTLSSALAHRQVFPVEIRLLGGEQVQMVLAAVGVPLPSVAAELGAPVVRRRIPIAVAPDVELGDTGVAILRGLEPRVLGRVWLDTMSHHDADCRAGGRRRPAARSPAMVP